jgi:hypothetical protein
MGGVLVGHAITYALANPDAHTRAAVLAGTGHGYLGLAGSVLFPLALLALATMGLGRLIHRGAEAPGPSELVTRLAGFQVVAYVIIEVTERLVASSGLSGIAVALAIGVPVQIAIAWTVAWVLRALFRVVDEAMSVAASTPVPRTATAALVLVAATAPATPVIGCAPIRGPPVAR